MNNRQQSFVDYFAEGDTRGNCYKSMIKAGYTERYAYGHSGTFIVVNSCVKEAIEAKLAEVKAVSIATRQQRQEFWSRVYHDSSCSMRDRLRASELLGKSEADFTENIKTIDVAPVVSEDERKAYEEAGKAFKLRMA